jgi:hypothetical protein
VTESVNGGTLSYLFSSTSGTCYWYSSGMGHPLTWTRDTYSDFSYTGADGLTQGLYGAASDTVLSANPEGYSNCPVTGASPYQLSMPAYGFAITFDTCSYQDCAAYYSATPSGDVNPKFVISAIVYAPPGPNSSVTYNTSSSESTYMGNTTDTASSFTQTFSVGNSWGGKIFAWLNGKVDITNTTTTEGQFTYANGTALTTTMAVTQKQTYYGTPVPWTGWWTTVNPATGTYYNMHDYDWALLWLNPVLPFNAPSGSNVTWYGYGYDYCDQGAVMDIYPVEMSSLAEGSTMPGSVMKVLNRPWTSSPTLSGCDAENFNSGTGALTTTDYNNIIAADPVYSESYQLNLSGNTSGDGRFTINGGVNGGPAVPLSFVQAQNGAPPQFGYTVTYTSSSQITHNTSLANTQTYGTTTALSGGVFIANFQSSLATTDSLTTTYSTQNVFTDTASKSASATIVGPPCNWTGSACDPTYAGPGEFDVYQDNLFGTFMFWPVSN